mgnify:CR=1 FL=1
MGRWKEAVIMDTFDKPKSEESFKLRFPPIWLPTFPLLLSSPPPPSTISMSLLSTVLPLELLLLIILFDISLLLSFFKSLSILLFISRLELERL